MEFVYFSTVSFYLIIYLFVFCFYYFLSKCNKKQYFLNRISAVLPKAPMPRSLPIIGHLHLLGQYEVPYQAFKVISKTHGLIYRLKLGSMPAIVVNGLDNIKEVLIMKASDFDGRPNFTRYNQLFSGNRENSLAFCNFSNLQKLRRDILQTHTFPRNFSSRFLKLDSIVNAEINYLKSKIDSEQVLPNFKSQLSSAIANVFFIYFCSKKFNVCDPSFQELIKNFDEIFFEVNQGYASDFLPWLLYFQSNNHINKMSKMSHSIRRFMMESLMDERIAMFNDKSNIKENSANDEEEDDHKEEDFVDSLLNNVYNGKDNKVTMDLDTAIFSLEDIVGGHAAISNFIMKVLGFLVNHPEVQTRIQKEIDSITLNERNVALTDRKSIPYTEATVLEAIRVITSPIVPHVATQDSSIGGFEVKKDTLIFLNNYDLNMSPDLWEEPEKFRPERFLNAEGRIIKPEHFLPFSGGRRSCMGNKMVQLISCATISSLLQSYDLKKLTGHDYKVPIGDLALPYNTFNFQFSPRKSK